jgi:hypothetical protein
MPELGTSGSVRGDASNGIPYRDKAGMQDAAPSFRNIAYAPASVPDPETLLLLAR